MAKNEPDLDLIGMVQRARMAHDADAQPSKVTAVYWIEAKRKTVGAVPTDGAAPTPRAGSFAIHTTLKTVDAQWAAIKAATEAGTLGYKSKVATASHAGSADERLIRVLTYDADDTADVARVREALAALGFSGELVYERGD
jgi:hypothetical protein